MDAVAAILEDTLDRVLEVHADCAKRKGGERSTAELAMLLFEPPPPC